MSTLPQPIQEELDRVKGLGKDYGLVFAVRDLYETTLKVICLAICSRLEAEADDRFCRILLSPKTLSFGDWVNDVPSFLLKMEYVRDHPDVKNYLKKLTRVYHREDIVRWRNDFLGHGLMSEPDDKPFFQDAADKIRALEDFLTEHELPEELDRLDFDHLEPFLYRTEEFFLFESFQCGEITLYTAHSSRRRVSRKVPYFTEKSKKYHDILSVALKQTVFGEDVYLSDEDESLSGFHLASCYKKPDHMICWVQACLDANAGGVFLLQGDRGTGKSAFALACDELNQHGKQKIKLRSDGDKVSVRAYYCSRIDFSGFNDFRTYITSLLEQLPDGKSVRSRSGAHREPGRTLGEILDFFREQYERFCGTGKLLLFIDGIDELTEKGQDLLATLPENGAAPQGVYIVLTCRNETEGIPPRVADFVNRYPFVDRVKFDRKKENHRLMSELLREQLDLPEAESDRLADDYDNRLSVIPLLLSLPKGTTLEPAGEQADAMQALAETYLDVLKLRYGGYFRDFLRFLMTISESTESLTLNEVSILSAHHNVTLREICFLKDAAPFLIELRSYRGNLFGISRPEYRDHLQRRHARDFADLLCEWRELLYHMDSNTEHTLTETEYDGLLYLCANLSLLEQRYAGNVRQHDGVAVRRFLENIYRLCMSTGAGNQIHRMRRAESGLSCVVSSLIDLVQSGSRGEDVVEFLLESAADIINRAVLLRDMDLADAVIGQVSETLQNNGELFAANTGRRRFMLARLYGNMMTRCCERYDTPEVERCYQLAIQALGEPDCWGDEEERCGNLKRMLTHNYLGAYRNEAPEETLEKAEELLKNADAREPTFSKANDFLMVAMCYKSAEWLTNAVEAGQSEDLLFQAKDTVETVIETRKLKRLEDLDDYEQETYFHIQWRLCQAVDERAYDNVRDVLLAELVIAIDNLDRIIEQLIELSIRGYAQFDTLRLELMTTAALLRANAARKTSTMLIGRGNVSRGIAKTPDDYRIEALNAVKIIQAGYDTLERGGVHCNKIQKNFGLMNCACVYACFGEQVTALALLDSLISGFVAENPQEETARLTLERKRAEIAGSWC